MLPWKKRFFHHFWLSYIIHQNFLFGNFLKRQFCFSRAKNILLFLTGLHNPLFSHRLNCHQLIKEVTYHTKNNPNAIKGPTTILGCHQRTHLPYWEQPKWPRYWPRGSWTSGEEGNGASGDNGVPGIIPMECLDLLTGL